MREVILEYIREQFSDNLSLNEINYDTPLITGGYIDSFSMVVVLIFLEKTFNIKIPDKEAIPENFNTINTMVELVQRRTK
jgi:acyl carrier protein